MAIQHRRGSNKDFQPTKMLPGEIAVTTDGTGKVYVAFSAGDIKELASKEDVEKSLAIQYGTDISLTEEGKAADAKATGEKIDKLKGDITNLENILRAIQEKLNTTPSVDSVTVNEINDMIVEYFENKTVSEVET